MGNFYTVYLLGALLIAGVCFEDTTLGKYGEITWPEVTHSVLVNKTCPFGGLDGSRVAYRYCNVINNAVVWGEPDYTRCKEVSVSLGQIADALK
jgi:hypothetical protein